MLRGFAGQRPVDDGFKQAGRMSDGVFARGTCPPLRSEQDCNVDDVTALRYAGTEFHSGTLNVTPQ